jgi:hypothetical protein
LHKISKENKKKKKELACINRGERERDHTLTPESFSSLEIESMTITSSPSSLIHTGRGVPQNRLLLTAQSLAFSSQL